MKYIWCSIVFLLISCSTTRSGSMGPDTLPMDNANLILIETSDSVEESHSILIDILKKEGFSLKSSNNGSLLVETNSKKYNNQRIWLTSNVIETDSSSVVELSGMVEVPQFRHRQEYGGVKPDVKNRIKKKNSDYNPAWKIMMGVALKYPEGKLWYAREES